FLGGTFRFVDGRSKYGVHRFYSEQSGLDSDSAQVVSAVIVQYIRDMGVDPALFNEMIKAGGTEINILPSPKLIALKVVNNGVGETIWTIESLDDGAGSALYLKGQRETIHGINKLLLICAARGKILLHAIFDPEGRAAEVMQMQAQSLVIDGNNI